jgi:DNA-binding GntR family transcriptional regulator
MPPTPRKTARRTPPRAVPAEAGERTDSVWRAYHELRNLIVWGQLPPGARISERIVAERLGLSRTPVRSAMHRLEQEGFIASYGRARERRLIVAPLTMHDGLEVLHIVGHLEGLAARTAAQLPRHRRDAIVRRLRELNDELRQQSRDHVDAVRFFDLDIEFHRSYVEGVAGPRLLTLHRAIKPQSERYIRLYVSAFLDKVSTSVHEHEKIVSSIARGDAGGAQRATENNWHNAAVRLARVIEQHGERGSWHTLRAPEPEGAPARRPRPLRGAAGRRTRD